jgi:ABC-2 type transport system ATP-binding protein
MAFPLPKAPGNVQPEVVLSVTGACKRFGEIHALNDVAISLRKGECLGLLGPNGAGKTTLVRAIAGRVRLDQGEIALMDEKTTADNGRRRLGVVPQDLALYGELTARENLEVFGSLLGGTGQILKQWVNWALEWTDLKDRSREPIKRFSGGMKRRLNLACGVIHRPEVVLLDEPTVGVDPQSRQRIWEMLAGLQAEGVSLLITTHQLDEVQKVCQRIVIIDHGRIIALGTMSELIEQTVGPRRRVTIVLEERPPASLSQQGFSFDENHALHHYVDEIGADLPALLTAVREAGGRIHDVRIETPGLQAVFLHLTGTELRE